MNEKQFYALFWAVLFFHIALILLIKEIESLLANDGWTVLGGLILNTFIITIGIALYQRYRQM